MSALAFWKAKAEEIARDKMKARAEGRDNISYVDCNGKSHHLYYHSGRWNDRPASIGCYKNVRP